MPQLKKLEGLRLVPISESGKDEVGWSIRNRAKKLGCWGGPDEIDWLLNNQGAIPKEFQKFRLIFPRIKSCHPMPYCTAVLVYKRGRWDAVPEPLPYIFVFSKHRLVQISKVVPLKK